MQKATYSIFVFIILPLFLFAQKNTGNAFASATEVAFTEPGNLSPIILSKPIQLTTQEGLLFRWDNLRLNDQFLVEYEFIVKYKDSTVLHELTYKNEFCLVGNKLSCFKIGKEYKASVNARLSAENFSYFLPAEGNDMPFKIEPNCSSPSNVRITNVGTHQPLITWDGLPAEMGVLSYKVRYRIKGNLNFWNEVDVLKGNQIKVEGLDDISSKYEYEVQKICYWTDGSQILSEWVSAAAPEVSKITLPAFSCGAPYTYTQPNCDSTNQVVDPNQTFDIIYFGGFPIEIQQITADSNYNNGNLEIIWTGTGLVPLPFGVDKYATVEFSSVVINLDNQVCGTRGIEVLRDVAPNLPDLTATNGFGNAEICVPLPSSEGFDSSGINSVTGLEWDVNGFGPDGKYIRKPPYKGYIPGFPMDTTLTYDPNGFDVNGINAITHTMYNLNGCSRDSLNALGQPCNPGGAPYSWMNNTTNDAPTEAGLAFAAQIKDSLYNILIQILNTLNAANNQHLNAKGNQCDSIRTLMQADVTTSGVNSSFVFGPNNEYFATGMHLNFTSPPQLMNSASWSTPGRNAAIKDLEKQHIALYVCDKSQYEFIQLGEVIASFLSVPGLSTLHETILDEIKRQPQATIEKFISDHTFFVNWLSDKVKFELMDKYTELYGVSTSSIDPTPYNLLEINSPINIKTKSPYSNYSTTGLLASNDFSPELLAQAEEVTTEDLRFEYLQGFRMINGVNRAFYLEAIANGRNHTTVLTQANPNLMPIELLTYGEDGKGFRVYLDNIHFNANGPATMDAFIVIDVPFNGQRIVFESIGVPFTPHGLLDEHGIKLQIQNDFPIRLSNNARMIIKGGPDTYVTMNCMGYAGMGIAADVELCRNIVKPIDPVTEQVLPEPRMVTGHFKIPFASFTGIYVNFVVDPFVITGAEDVKWKVDSISLDLSEVVSPSGTPPPGYNTALAGPSGFTPLWKGFYARNIEVTLPRNLRKDHGPCVVGVHNLLIDPMGVSCSVSASNLLPLNQGNAGGWGMSIDEFELTVLMSNISKAEFSGKVHVPLFRDSTNTSNTLKKEDCFNYSALIRPKSTYQFTASQQPGIVYAADLWKAGSVRLDSSLLQMTIANDSFKVFARLSGAIAIKTNLTANVPVDIPTITFQGLEISNIWPYFSPGVWKFPIKVGARFTGFELGFRNIGMVKTLQGEPALNFDVHIQVSDDTTKIKATGGFSIIGELVVIDGEQHWRYKRLKVNDIDIDGSFAGVATVHGFARFFEGNSIYGTGFRGGLQAKFEMLQSEVNVVGQFGRVQGMKYFMIDALYCAAPGAGINLAGAFELNGIGGGAYYHMRRPDQAVDLGGCGVSPDTTLGASLSGIIYQPTDTVRLGIKLTVAGATVGKPEAFNANATLEFQFGDGGGLDKVWLYGNGKFMVPLELNGVPEYVKDQLPNNTASVKANVSILMDFENRVFSGQLETYMNVAGVLRGRDPIVPDRVCFADIKFSPNEWYIKIGGPAADKRVGIMVEIPGMKDPAFVFSSYLQVGNNIDPLPPLPLDILTALNRDGVDNQYDSGRSNSNLDGFAFGVDVQMGGHFNYLVLYSEMNAHLGFDVNVAKSTVPLACNGHPFGINGWYAQGQIYAALGVEMGLEAKVFGSKRQFKVLSATVGAALEAKLPNPFWAHGQVAYEYNLLGLIKGEGDFDFEIGEKCQFSSQGSITENASVILDVRPGPKSIRNIVQSIPSATFNFPVGQNFSFEELGGNSNVFKVSLDTAQLYWRGYTIPLRTLDWRADKQQVRLIPESFLPGNDTIRMLISVHIDSNGVMIDRERRDIWFTTGDGLKTIVQSNVKGSYPLNGQYNFYKKELQNGKGYIQLDRAQPDVMISDNQYIKVARFKEEGGDCRYVKLDFSSENFWDKKLEFPLPDASYFESGKVYEMQIVDYPATDPNWGADFSGQAPCICNGCITPPSTPSTPALGGVLSPVLPIINDDPVPPPANNNPATTLTERIVYSAYFRVSAFGTFAEKMEELKTILWSIQSNKEGNVAEEAPVLGAGLEFEVPISEYIEPFDWCDNKYMDIKIDFNPAQSDMPNSHFISAVPQFYLEPWARPNYTYTLPGGIVSTTLPPGKAYYPPDRSLAITDANNTGLRITKQHFLNGLPANFVGPQKLKIFVMKSLSENAAGLLNSLAVFESQYMNQIRQVAQCTSPNQPLCDCPKKNYWENLEDYHIYFSGCVISNTISTGVKSYPISFRYIFPGTNETMGDSFIIFANH